MNNPTLILPETCRIIEQGMIEHLHTGVQIYVSLAGEIIADFGLGHAQPDTPMTADSITLWLSSGKPVTAVALAILKEKEEFDWDEPVNHFFPEWNNSPKEIITLKHLLTHTSGLQPVITGWPHASWKEIISTLLKMNLREGILPGQRAEYQPACTWFLLGEIIARISGMPYQQFIKEKLMNPLGMSNTYCGMTPEVYKKNQTRISLMYARRKTNLLPLEIHSETHCCATSPGGNFRGTARDLGHFYEMLLDQGKTKAGQTILKPETIEELISPHRTGLYDHTFQHEIKMGLGLVLDSRNKPEDPVPYGYGKQSSRNCFGHGGAQSSIGFCDPDNQLVVVVISNGMAGEPRHNRRSLMINEAIYQDIGLS